ncbi:type II-A CRISPR-associated protein Csn2 [Lapidilactobacillus dextrinicus]|uniref:type II-A CRISPR-associated protein Csn2 n=1 Tax=Lapidilactobacillus dextrinicus TaxID=51664 RepID=UPI00384F5341
MANIIKLCNISFINTLKTQPYDIIEAVLKCASELNERSILVLTNVHQYLSVSQFQELVRLIETLDLSTLLIEFSEKKKLIIMKIAAITILIKTLSIGAKNNHETIMRKQRF